MKTHSEIKETKEKIVTKFGTFKRKRVTPKRVADNLKARDEQRKR
jgi:hypothetical protein